MRSVLIVDDEEGIRTVLDRWLTSEGYATRQAATAEEAVVAMTIAAADVVLCDIEMPGQGGLWLAAQLRERFPHTAIILATAVDTIPQSTSFRSGITDYLVKPFERSLVLGAMTSAVAWHVAALAKPPARTDGADLLDKWMDSDVTGD